MMLLHVCCADCSLKMIEAIKSDPEMKEEELNLYYYNPNIHPQSEFTARQIAVQKIAAENNIKVIIANWTPGDYFQALEGLPEANRFNKLNRCRLCVRLRLTQTFKFAAENKYSFVSSTTQTSNYMPIGVILKIGEELAQKNGVEFYHPPQINCELKTSGFYKQNYCGCVYSLLERMGEKYGTNKRGVNY
jgi:epoxyqueuosine reductase